MRAKDAVTGYGQFEASCANCGSAKMILLRRRILLRCLMLQILSLMHRTRLMREATRRCEAVLSCLTGSQAFMTFAC